MSAPNIHLVFGLASLAFLGCGLTVSPPPAGLTPTPSKLDLGVVSPGSRVKATIKVANHSPAQIHIHSFETSCDCLRVQPPSAVVNSGQSIDLIIDLDLSHDPTFTGSLSLSVQGHCNPGSDFSLTVTADVKR